MPSPTPTCRIVPLADHQVAFLIGDRERLRWHYGDQYPRPFFFPLIGPAGGSLTRMGHPGAPNHEHHRSIWFAHANVDGHDFWSDNTKTKIQQQHWLAYVDGEREATMAVEMYWLDPTGQRLLTHEMVASLKLAGSDPGQDNELFLELQSRFSSDKTVKLGQSNFGILGVRVAKSISTFFGDGMIANSEGQFGEPNIFGQSAQWMDYSGTVRAGNQSAIQGVTYFDHQDNPNYPAHWHVREDGWMGASLCRLADVKISSGTVNPGKPLTVRYLLHSHLGKLNTVYAQEIGRAFNASPDYVVKKATTKHRQFTIVRE